MSIQPYFQYEAREWKGSPVALLFPQETQNLKPGLQKNSSCILIGFDEDGDELD